MGGGALTPSSVRVLGEKKGGVVTPLKGDSVVTSGGGPVILKTKDKTEIEETKKEEEKFMFPRLEEKKLKDFWRNARRDGIKLSHKDMSKGKKKKFSLLMRRNKKQKDRERSAAVLVLEEEAEGWDRRAWSWCRRRHWRRLESVSTGRDGKKR